MFVSASIKSLVIIALSATQALAIATGVSEESIRVGEHVITVTTSPISASRASSLNKGVSRVTTSLTKRLTVNACEFGCSLTCANGLSTSPDPPLSEDCTALRTALQQLAASEVKPTNPFPCAFPNQPTCPSFTLQPQFERAYSLGTCLVGVINLNPMGGALITYCNYLIAGSMNSLYNGCIGNQMTTGALCLQTLQTNTFYAIELRHV